TSTPSPLARDTAAVNRGAEPAPERAPAGPVAAAAAPADAIATLSVQVRWSDGGPAPAMWVCLAPADSADWFAQRWLLADRFGVALYRPVTPGAYEVRCRLGGSAAVEVAAGTVNEVELRIPAGIDVRGTVVDPEGRLVPDACIVLGTGSDDALEVARTDGNGAFFLRSVAAGGLVAAFADGFAGSAARPVREFEQGALELRLMGLAGVVTGRVLDADGRPLAGAWVAHGYSHTAMVGGPDAGRAILRTELTDATGSFRLQGVPFAQPWPLHAGAVGHAAWRGEVRVTAGEPEFVEVRLRRAVRLHGTVHDAAGQPQRAHVHVVDANAPGEGIADQRPSWSRAAAFTRADGMFEFANLPAGDLLAAATDHQGGVDSRSFEAGDGDDLTWDPVLASEREIHGRLVDRAGAALAGWRIVAHGDEGVPTPDSATTGDDGAFELRGCAPAVYELFVYAPGDAWHAPILRRPEVRPSPTPVELVVGDGAVPSCRVVGRLAADAAADGLAVVLVGPGGHVAMATDLVAGEPFELGPLPAGTYQLQLQQSRGKGFCAQVVCGLGSCTLAPGQRHDLGDIRMPALGEVEVRLVDAAGDPVARADVVFGLLGAPMGGSAVAIRDGHGLAEFGPGSYLPSYVGDGLCIEHPPFEVTGGRRTIVSLVAAASVHRQVRYDLGAVGWTTRAFATWRKDGRALRWQWFSFWQEKPTVHDEQFTPGVWELELEVGDGSRHRFPFVVTADDTGPILEVVVPK
ncbi:MAG: carboxypeptidase regulatory-like domain-containing protein, partial [Planctomycetes bacterium]|nr:carboxypeptidase regulatory-like domain-containing protein [Planctomycetota bacterium]